MKKIQSRIWVLIFQFWKKDLLIKLTMTFHLTNMLISTSKLAHHTEIIAEESGTQEYKTDDEESDNVEGKPIIKPGTEEV